MLKTMSPYYMDKREMANNTLHAKCGHHKKVAPGDIQLKDFIKSGEGSDSNLNARIKMARERRMF